MLGKGARGMYANLELLNYIYQNAQMGIESLKELIEISEDTNFKKVMEKQLQYYKDAFEEAGYLIGEVHEIPKGIGVMQNISTSTMIKAKTLTNKTPSHIAEMLIQGTTMGIIELRKHLNHYTENEVDKRSLELARKLMDNEEQHIEELKKYL